jgi:hypothetical protein
MLRFDVHHDDVPSSWHWQNAAWRSGSSWVVPFTSPALRTDTVLTGRGVVLAVREIRPGGDFVEVTLGRDGAMQVKAGPIGVAPVYAATSNNRAIGSWDPVDLAPFATVDTLSPAIVASLLTRRHRYSADTLFSPIMRVTAGATLAWSRSTGLEIRYPEPVRHIVEPCRLRVGTDPVKHFGRLMDHLVRDLCERHPGATAVELSGGLDSANVAMSVAQMSPAPVTSGGLLVAGTAGRAQSTRRRTLVEHLGLRDTAVAASDHLPLAPDGPRTADHAHYPDTDVYMEAFDVLRASLHSAGARVVFTGYGGDEIMSRAPGERSHPATPPRLPPWLGPRTRDALADVDVCCSPVTAVALATLVVFAARHPTYLRTGLWPIAPFGTPELSRFGRSLPIEWRTGKELLRQRLARIALPPAVTHPRRPESFNATMHLALRRYGAELLRGMLDHSVLIAHGFVRRDAVEDLYRKAHIGRLVPTLVYDMLAVDIGIRSMCAAATTRRESPCPSSTLNP